MSLYLSDLNIMSFVSAGGNDSSNSFVILIAIMGVITLLMISLLVQNVRLLMQLRKRQPEFFKMYQFWHYLLLLYATFEVLRILQSYFLPSLRSIVVSIINIGPFRWVHGLIGGSFILPVFIMLAYNWWLKSRLDKKPASKNKKF